MTTSSTSSLIGDSGARVDLLIRQGATFGPHTVVLTNPDTTPVNLTGCTLRAQIRRSTNAADIAATLAIDVTNASAGTFTYGLSAALTAALAAGSTYQSAESRYVWDLELEDTLGRVTALAFGDVYVQAEVTR